MKIYLGNVDRRKDATRIATSSSICFVESNTLLRIPIRGIIMKKLLVLLTSIVLATNISASLAAGHKSKSAENSSQAGAGRDGGTNSENGRHGGNRHEVDADHGHSDSGPDKDKDKDKSANNKGNEKSQEMRDRRDERKDIQDDYRANREPGQESKQGDGKTEKKPWYKFWE